MYMGPWALGEKDRGIGPVSQNGQSRDYAMDKISRLFVASITLKAMASLDHTCSVLFCLFSRVMITTTTGERSAVFLESKIR